MYKGVSILLGIKVREKRIEIGMSIKDLAESSGLTSGFISQVERGLAEPSISSLRNIASALGVAVFYFLLDDVDVNPVVRKDETRLLKFPQSKMTYELLSPDLNRQMEMFKATLHPGEETSKGPFAHSGEEVLHVTSGSARIQIGDESYDLETGDTIHFNSGKPHKIACAGDETLVFISTTTPPAEMDTFKRKR